MNDPAGLNIQEPVGTWLFVDLARAGWGAGVGLAVVFGVVALVMTLCGSGSPRVLNGVLESGYLKDYLIEPWQERYERLGYVMLCVVCPLAAGAGVRWLRAPGWAAAVSALGCIPAGMWACAGLFQDVPTVSRFPVLLAVLAPPLGWGVRRLRGESPMPLSRAANVSWAGTVFFGIPLFAILALVLWPAHLTTAAGSCRDQGHVAIYLVVPALYYHAPGTVPGLDFESLYGLGHAYSFSFFCGDGLIATMAAYVAFMVVITILYFLSAYLVLTDWFGHPGPAFLTTLVLLAASWDGIALTLPSNWPVRHPFLFLFLFATVRGTVRGGVGAVWAAASGVITGVSIFWQTDIGLLTAAAGIVFFAASWWFRGHTVGRLPLFAAAILVTFFALCVVCFGPRTLSEPFVRRVLEPLLLFAGGFGNELVAWRAGWWYLYNLIGPGAALATVGVAITRRPASPDRPIEYAFLASLLGLAMLTKWVNRSIDMLWMLNGGLVIVVLCWWGWVWWESVSARWLRCPNQPLVGRLRRVTAVAALGGLAVLLREVDHVRADPNHPGCSSSPLVRIEKNLKAYPSIYTHWRRPTLEQPPCSPVAADKVAFLRERTAPTERVAVISGMDWMYLADADRAPQFHWIPIGTIHSYKLLARCAEDLWRCDRVFVEYGAPEWLRDLNPRTYQALIPVLERDFEVVEYYGNSWRVYQRRTVGQIPGPSIRR